MRPKRSLSNENGSDPTSESSVRKVRPTRRKMGSRTVSGATSKAAPPVVLRRRASSSNSGNGSSSGSRTRAQELRNNPKQRRSDPPRKRVSMEIATHDKKGGNSRSHDPPTSLAAKRASKFKQSFENKRLPGMTPAMASQSAAIIVIKPSRSSSMNSHSMVNVSSTQSSSHHSNYVPSSKAVRQINPIQNDTSSQNKSSAMPSSQAKSSAMPPSEQTSALSSNTSPVCTNRFIKPKKGSNRSSTESTYSPPTTSPSTSTTSKRKSKPKKPPSTGKQVSIQVNARPSTPASSVAASPVQKTKHTVIRQPPSSQPSTVTSESNPKTVTIVQTSVVATAISGSPQQRSAQSSSRCGLKQSPINGSEKPMSSPVTPSSIQPSPTQDETVDSPANTPRAIHEGSEFSGQTDYFIVKRICDFVNRCSCIQISDLLKEYEEARKVLPSESVCGVGLTPFNRPRNRYNDILCIDATRVILRFPEGVTDDYIHANTVSGRHLHNRFILTQGPLSRTMPDFWRLIWQEKVPLIFMLCNNLEDNKRKCADYLPSIDSDGMTVCGIRIVVVAQNHHSRRTLTETKLLLTHGDKEHRVSHWKWLGWPDYKVPTQDLQIPFRLLKMSRVANGSTVVHCSAGVGRSGSLVALELCLTDLADGEELKVRECVEFLRRQRAHSVQSAVQYLFIHRALLEFAVSSNLVPPKAIEMFVANYDEFMSRTK
uniref:Tyrosine-protein phosphatase domain-containing protein n=1 Tax=Panagrellus redivivus TaxID=6233 RepID=A0A7E4VM01_PANRE